MIKPLHKHLSALHQNSVIIRCNFDIPLSDGRVTDDTRIKDSLKTITAVASSASHVILLAHAGRPDGHYQADLSLLPVQPVLESLLQQPVGFVSHQHMFSSNLPSTPIILMDNLRFFTGEEANHPSFTLQLASLGQAYVNEAFANSHRDHASITGLPAHLPSYLGISFTQELAVLDRVRSEPQRPLVVVLGGAKLETKQPLIQTFIPKADSILIGGKLAVELQSQKTDLPAHVILADLTPSQKDITPASAHRFADIIAAAGTVIWNGTMGVFEEPEHRQGTHIVAQAVNQTSAFTLVGGGDTEAALTVLDAEANVSHISSGGGAMITYLSTGKLVGLSALDQRE